MNLTEIATAVGMANKAFEDVRVQRVTVRWKSDELTVPCDVVVDVHGDVVVQKQAPPTPRSGR